MRLWMREVRQLIGNSIDIVEKILSGNSSEVWSENDESSIHRTTSQSFQPISRQNVNITRLFQSPLKFLYYFYIWLPLFWCTLGIEYLKLTLQVSARRSSKLYMILRQINSFYIQVIDLYHAVRAMNLIDIINWTLQTSFECIYTMINGPVVETILVDVHYAELLFYEEFENLNPLPRNIRRQIRSSMHYEVSTNPFIACIRAYPTTPGQTHRRISTNTGWIEYDPKTPASHPYSPNTRTSWKNSINQRVDDTLQKAKERLISYLKTKDS